jgi:hypothetical protein
LLNKLPKKINTTARSILQPRHGASRLVEIEIQVLAGIGKRVVGRSRDGVACYSHLVDD